MSTACASWGRVDSQILSMPNPPKEGPMIDALEGHLDRLIQRMFDVKQVVWAYSFQFFQQSCHKWLVSFPWENNDSIRFRNMISSVSFSVGPLSVLQVGVLAESSQEPLPRGSFGDGWNSRRILERHHQNNPTPNPSHGNPGLANPRTRFWNLG